MTNPDERRSRIRVSGPTEGIVPLNFGAALAAQIPQVEMPADWNASREFGLPVVRPEPGPMEWRGAPMGKGVGMVGLGINMAAAIPQVQMPVGWDAPLANPVPVFQYVAATIPQVQLPVGWKGQEVEDIAKRREVEAVDARQTMLQGKETEKG